MLWFEPERVVPESRVVLEHPEWILTHDWYNGLKILDLSQPECCDYLIKKIGDLIEKYRVKIYRQDYNLDEPLRLWKNKDVDGRYGATENLYVQGYLRFWDALLERFPGLVIDSCASGGSRNDIETLRRAVVLHQSDYGYGNHPIQQSFSQTLYSWIPYFRGFGEMDEREDGTYGTDAPMKNLPIDDEFNVLHSFAPITSVFAKFVRQDCTEEQYAKMREYRKLYDEIAPTLCTGDFYALTPYHKSRKKWTVWQFDTPENDCGIIEVIRNNAAQDDVLSVLPRLKSGKYIFKNMISGEQKVYSGGTIEFDQPLRSITFWKYIKTE